MKDAKRRLSFSRPEADVYTPDGSDPASALAGLTHLCVAAHQDDIEIMAHAGICDCLDQPGKAFGGVVVTDGSGSSRTGPYASFSDEQIREVRREEQRQAARLGRYAIQLQLAHPSADIKSATHSGVAADLDIIFAACRPEVLYLHQPADKHDTHVALFLRCLEALRRLPVERRPRQVLGCEVWRDLDWLPDAQKVALNSGRHAELGMQLLRAFDSQISGGKRYDLATAGRRLANATYHDARSADAYPGITWAMDLTPLVHDEALDPVTFTLSHIDQLGQEVRRRLITLGGKNG